MGAMKSYASFCPVAKTAEIFAERWTPLILRELFVGACRFGELQQGLPQISRALLSQRLRELELEGVVEKVADGRRHTYRLTPRGEAFRPLIDLMAEWGQTHGRGRVTAEDSDPEQMVWAMRRHLDLDALPPRRLVLQIEFGGLAPSCRTGRYWWMVLDRPEVDLCQKHPGHAVDVVLAAKLKALTLVWLGHRGLAEARRAGEIRFSGAAASVRSVCRALGLREQPWTKRFDFSQRDDPFGPSGLAPTS